MTWRDDALCVSSTCIMFIIVYVQEKWHDVKVNHSRQSCMIQLSSENLLFHFYRKASEKIFQKRLFALRKENFTRSNLFCGISFRMYVLRTAVCGKWNSLNIMHTVPMMIPQKPHTDSRLVTQKPITALETSSGIHLQR